MKVLFPITRHRKWYFAFSLLITVLGIVVILLFGFNLGTDFRAGSRVQMDLGPGWETQDIVHLFQNQGLSVSAADVTSAGARGETAVVRLKDRLDPAKEPQLTAAIQKQYPQAKIGIDSVEPLVARELSRNAMYGIGLASLGILVYVAIRFEFRFGVTGVVALLHDAFIVISLFALLRREIDLPFIAAVLTIVGYSINDTIVIFDRIRDNLKNAKIKTIEDLEHLVDQSLWQTMRRSIYTVLTVVIAALSLFLFGSASIHNFSLALLIGLISGAYSSIFIASPLWVAWRGRELRRTAAK
ncbi:protein translocase subunit SecF [Kyrpidia tusciae]|uniref:protein translocase subunit SecF n=1 Tax=Kyrpidia tusciae TaxID=33943 RepID=UPI0003055839|nr:protein translocase subunit SecF [Kyrpidia tusciae]